MKQIITRLSLVAVLLSLSLSLFAAEEIDGIYYYLFDDYTATVEIANYSGDLVIPETIMYNGHQYTVSRISERAFSGCSGLTSVIIPNSVTVIGSAAFSGCSSLTSVTIPNSVTAIYSGTFFNCSGLTSVTIPNSVTEIWRDAFSGCSSLTSVTIPNSVTEISYCAFKGCSSLASVTIPNSVTYIDRSAFEKCSGLTSVTISNSVKTICDDAFYGCFSLTSVHISDLEAWCKIEFGYSSFSNPLYYAHHLYLGEEEITDLVIPNSVTSIGSHAFESCSSLTSVTIPNSVTEIGGSAFSDCSSLTSVTIGNSVTSIGNYAFSGCSGLTSVTIPNSVTEIRIDAFRGCSSLTSVTILCKKVGNWFKGIKSIKVIVLGDNVTSIGSHAFESCSSLTSVTIPNSVTEIGGSAFEGCSSLTSVTIPNSVTEIGCSAFMNCSSLTSITIPNGVTSIKGDYHSGGTFEGCSSLTSVEVPNSVTEIGINAFGRCSSLISVEIPNSVREIGKQAFYSCSSLASVIIPNSVTKINGWTFYGCSSLTSVTIPNCVTSIGDGAFSGCRSLTSITIPNGVTSVGREVFYDCNDLTSVEIPNSVTEIGYNAFYGCGVCTLIMLGSSPPKTEGSINVKAIEVPIGSTLNYAYANNWSEIETIYAIDGEIAYCPVLPSVVAEGEALVHIVGIKEEGIEVPTNEFVEIQVSNNSLLPYGLVMKNGCEITNYFNEEGKYYFNPVPQYKENIVTTYSYTPTDVKVSTSGTLIDQIGTENIEKISCLKLSGNLNGTDILTIRKMKNLKLLDLSDAHIVNGGMSYYDNYTTSENTIGEHFYDGLNSLLRIKLPLDINAIKSEAFSGCYNVLTLFIPKSVKEIPINFTAPLSKICSIQIEDFSSWFNTKIIFSNNFSNYNYYHLFLKDKEITDLIIPEGTKSVQWFAFRGCAWIKTVLLPSSVTSIGEKAFWGCENITSVTSLNPTPPEITKEVFTYYHNTTLYVPKGSKTLYWLHPYWEKFSNIVELDDTGINDVIVDSPKNSKGVYTIDGVKLSANADNIDSLPKGIYIVNGEKVIIK